MNTLLDSALKILSLRPHSKQEVINFLRKKTKDDTLINQTIEKLEKAKLINDEEFAKWYVESRSRTRPRGQRLLNLELKQKGINIETMNDDRMTMNDEIALAQKALDKKARLWSNLPEREFNQKTWRFLMTRGFSSSAIEKVVKKRYT
ncbi:MAG: regulatory protein [Microgenomates group bacterium Gr01-1014_16]|nr:MAG: regulatory protein [Microgenomates group bacterium Gr01-1014_16]